MLYLKQSTAITAKIGPFLDDTDGKTAETGLTISQADVQLSKNGGAMAQKNDATSCTHDALGVYGCPLNTTDTDTLGRLQLFVIESGALPVWHEYMVVTANVYDTLCSTDKFDVQVAAYDDIDFPATQKTQITTIDTVVDAVKAKTDNLPADPASETNVDANETKIDTVDTVVDAIKAKTDNLPSDPADESLIEAAITSAHTTTDGKVDGVQTDVTAIKGYVDTEVAAIKAVTDTLSLAAIADAVLDEVTEGTTTLRHAIKLVCSALMAKTSGGGTNTLVARDIGDTKNRITLTTDANGNRTASTLDGA